MTPDNNIFPDLVVLVDKGELTEEGKRVKEIADRDSSTTGFGKISSVENQPHVLDPKTRPWIDLTTK